MIYSEGNAAYLMEKLSYLDKGAVDFDKYEEADPETNLININFNSSNNPISFTESAVGNKLYTTTIPSVSLSKGQVIASTSSRHYPACFLMQGLDANGGKIVCNLGLPTIGGIKELKKGSRQLQWTLNTILFTWAKNIDLTRSIWNQLPDSLTAGKNAVSYDRVDTFEVRILVRNLSNHPVAGVQIVENIRPYFSFVDVKTPGIVSDISGHRLTISGVVLPPNSESLIVYRLRTPDADDKIHENVDKYISWRNYIYGSYNITSYSLTPGQLYYFKAWANNSEGFNDTANEKTFLTKPNATVAGSFNAQTNSTSVIYLTWTKGDGANTTYIERNKSIHGKHEDRPDNIHETKKGGKDTQYTS